MDPVDDFDDDYCAEDSVIDKSIIGLHKALDNPQQYDETVELDTLENLLTLVNLEGDTPQEFSEIIERIIRLPDSEPQIENSPSNNLIADQQSATQSTSTLKEKSSKSSTLSFFLRLLGRKRLSKLVPSIPSFPSVDSTNNIENANASALQVAEKEIDQLANQGLAGLVHLSPLNHVINRRIQIWTSSMDLYNEVGRKKSGEALNIQFHSNENGIPGHWTLLGNEDPVEIESNLNDCLFNTIAAHTGLKPSELQTATIERMRQNIHSLANRIQKIAEAYKCGQIILMIGGAKYSGCSVEDAHKILDNSQNVVYNESSLPGHPRSHASHPGVKGHFNSAENYSKTFRKTAFMSLKQDEMANILLRHSKAKKAMDRLNKGKTEVLLQISASDLSLENPYGYQYENGERVGNPRKISHLFIILRHHVGEQNNEDFDVFVKSMYPKLYSENQKENEDKQNK